VTDDELDPDQPIDDASPAFVKCTVMLGPGRSIAYNEAAWHDAIVFVTEGQVELEWRCGRVQRFSRGDILCLAHLPLRTVRSNGPLGARLVAISRRVRRAQLVSAG